MKKSGVFVFFALALAILVCMPNKVLAKTYFITGKKISVDVGKKNTIEVLDTKNKKITFKSSNKKIVTVNKKGDIKGKKTGKAKITVKVGKKKKKITVSVLPNKVNIISAQTVSSTSVIVKWNKLKEAKGYYVYYSTDINGKYSQKKTTKTELKIDGLPGGYYYFKIKAYGNSNTVSSKYSDIKSAKIWKLVWADEFTENKINTNIWDYKVNTSKYNISNIVKYNCEDNIKLDGNNLVVIPRIVIPNDFSGLEDERWKGYCKETYNTTPAMSSAYLVTSEKKSVKYGKIDIRAKVSAAVGTEQYGSLIEKTNGLAEIDLFSAVGNEIETNIFVPYFSTRNNTKTIKNGLKRDATPSLFHTYTILKTKNKIAMYVDGKYVGKLEPSDYNAVEWGLDIDFNLFIFNLLNAEKITKTSDLNSWASKKIDGDKTIYEDYMYVDYVRVYE